MSNSYYDSNRPYNPQQSNRPIYNVLTDEQLNGLKRPSKTEGAMWGAAHAMMGATLYSGVNEVVRKSDPRRTMMINPQLGGMHALWNNAAELGDRFGEDKIRYNEAKKIFDSVDTSDSRLPPNVASQINETLDKSHLGRRSKEIMDGIEGAYKDVQTATQGIGQIKTADFSQTRNNNPTAHMSSTKEKLDYHARNSAPNQLVRSGSRTLFGTGAKANLRRIAFSAIPGAATGALHNASNAIMSPY